MADRIGQTLGKYRLTRLLGQGGFAEVYLGVHIHLGSPAAIKVLHALLATPGEIEKFRQEAQIFAALLHPHIVRVLDFDVEDGTPYLVMDYAPNGSLRQRLPSGAAHDPREVLPFLTQAAEGLQYAHDQKLIHRDIKPENMLLGRQHEVLLGDFGIAVVAQNTSLQKTLGVAGTTAYMAPEQLQGKPRPSSDVYSLGVVVYEWLTGERPFQGAPMEVASQHVLAPPPPLRDKVPAIPVAVEQAVLTALAKEPKDRFGSARAFANAFAQACQASYSSATLSTLPEPAQSSGNQPAISPSSPGGNTIFGATTHITPSLTPGFSNPQMPAVQGGLSGPSIYDAQTQLTPSTAATSLAAGGSGSAPSWEGAGSGANEPPGIANQVTPAPVFFGGTPPGGVATREPPPAGGQSVSRKIGRGDGETFPTGQAPPVAVPGATEKARRIGGASRWALAIAASLLVLAAIGGGGVYAFTHFWFRTTTSGPSATTVTPPTSATVTITPGATTSRTRLPFLE